MKTLVMIALATLSANAFASSPEAAAKKFLKTSPIVRALVKQSKANGEKTCLYSVESAAAGNDGIEFEGTVYCTTPNTGIEGTEHQTIYTLKGNLIEDGKIVFPTSLNIAVDFAG